MLLELPDVPLDVVDEEEPVAVVPVPVLQAASAASAPTPPRRPSARRRFIVARSYSRPRSWSWISPASPWAQLPSASTQSDSRRVTASVSAAWRSLRLVVMEGASSGCPWVS